MTFSEIRRHPSVLQKSRLGREAIKVGYAFKQIVDAGVRVFFYLTNQERTLDSATDKMLLALTNFASEFEREKASQRTHDAMMRKAKSLYVTGNKFTVTIITRCRAPIATRIGHSGVNGYQ